jgi:hypothetical protein
VCGKLQEYQFQSNEPYKALVGDFCQGGGASTRGRTSTSNNQQRLKGMLHMIIPHPEKKHKDGIVCSKQNVPDGRKETTYICET